MRKRTLLASTNPVHSLSGLLDQNVYGKVVAVNGVPNLWAYEIDTKENIERSKTADILFDDWQLAGRDARGTVVAIIGGIAWQELQHTARGQPIIDRTGLVALVGARHLKGK